MANEPRQPSVIRGTFIYESSLAETLFDTGASRSFIAASFVKTLGLKLDVSKSITSVKTPLSICVVPSFICRSGEILISGHYFPCDLIVLDMSTFDIILGMDWLAIYDVGIECGQRRVTLHPENNPPVQFIADREISHNLTGSIKNSLNSLLMSLSISETNEATTTLPPIVGEFMDVFPDDLTKLPPHREVEFGIYLIPGTNPISIAPYCLALAELKEMQI